MALVDYSSSGEEEEESASAIDTSPSQNLKRKREDSSSDLPPLPSKFHDLYASTTRLSTRDDPSLHGGRTRAAPHVEGNWPTHLYIEWYPSTIECSSLNAVISSLKDATPRDISDLKLHSFLTSDLGVSLPLHASLSRPIGFTTDQKDGFVESLDHTIKSSTIRPFNLSFTSLDWVPNFEKTRWFLVLRIQKPDSNALNKLLHICNTVVQEFGQPPLYSKPTTIESDVKQRTCSGKKKSPTHSNGSISAGTQDLSLAFHISIAWTLTAPTEELLALTKSVMRDRLDMIKQIQVAVEEIKAKVGNSVTGIPLPKSVTLGRNLFGL